MVKKTDLSHWKKAVGEEAQYNEDHPYDEPIMQKACKRIVDYKKKVRNRKTAIRAFCIECVGGSIAEVRSCDNAGCSLWLYRNGDDAFRGMSTPSFSAVKKKAKPVKKKAEPVKKKKKSGNVNAGLLAMQEANKRRAMAKKKQKE